EFLFRLGPRGPLGYIAAGKVTSFHLQAIGGCDEPAAFFGASNVALRIALVWRVSLYPILLAGPPGEPERPPAASHAQATYLLVHHVDPPPRCRDCDDRQAVAGRRFLAREESSP